MGLHSSSNSSKNLQASSPSGHLRDSVQETGSSFSTGNHSSHKLPVLFLHSLPHILHFCLSANRHTTAASSFPSLGRATPFHNQTPVAHKPTNGCVHPCCEGQVRAENERTVRFNLTESCPSNEPFFWLPWLHHEAEAPAVWLSSQAAIVCTDSHTTLIRIRECLNQ